MKTELQLQTEVSTEDERSIHLPKITLSPSSIRGVKDGLMDLDDISVIKPERNVLINLAVSKMSNNHLHEAQFYMEKLNEDEGFFEDSTIMNESFPKSHILSGIQEPTMYSVSSKISTAIPSAHSSRLTSPSTGNEKKSPLVRRISQPGTPMQVIVSAPETKFSTLSPKIEEPTTLKKSQNGGSVLKFLVSPKEKRSPGNALSPRERRMSTPSELGKFMEIKDTDARRHSEFIIKTFKFAFDNTKAQTTLEDSDDEE
eukprot:CAMPEP_0115045990 /NCGR_PEP_ID=MMETSP0216-20121206/48495_1 /TAXON_ID=223996 /ORGANISM="Protocruzia adherens, Strain Boccale" /LENGTH=256 /DNA_ID=CAMNT_0002429011 /DNA_START=300 /DNA_END=1070 /DNA_ORIENTATION=-